MLISANASGSSGPGKRIAVVVGVNCTPHSILPPLNGAIADAEEMEDILKQRCNFEMMMPSLLNRDATSANVKRAVLNLARNRTNEDFLLFYFSGHAQQMIVNSNSNIPAAYLGTSDFDEKEVEDDYTLHVSMHWLRDQLFKHTTAGQVMIILDCCYAEDIRTKSDHFLDELRQHIAYYFEIPGAEVKMRQSGLRVALAASRYDQPAGEQGGHGKMTRLLLHALRGKVPRLLENKGRITLLRMLEYIKNEMPSGQKPVISWSDSTGEEHILASYPELVPRSPSQISPRLRFHRPENYIPSQRSPLFQPRPNEFEQLEHLLFEPRTKSVRIGLVGMPGLGKTELAIQLAYHFKDRFPAGIFWMAATGNSLFEWQQQVAKLAANAKFLPSDDDVSHPENEVRRAQNFFRYLADHPDALLILDHVDTPSLLVSAPPTLAGGEVECTILYTSRNKLAPPGVTIYAVKHLQEESALRLLLETTRESLLAEILAGSQDLEAQSARSVCRGVGYLPLALVYLRGLLAQDKDLKLSRLAEVLRKRGVFDMIKTYEFEEDAKPLFEMFWLSWKQVYNEEAQRLFKLASYFPEAAAIPLWLLGLATGLGEDGDSLEPLGKARMQLEKLSFLEEQSKSHVRLHPLVREFGQQLVAKDPMRVELLEMAGKRLIDEFTDLNRLELRVQHEGYSGCMEKVRAAREYAELLGTSHGELLKRIEKWMVRESYVLGDKEYLPGDKRSWYERIPGFFYQQIFNRSVEEGYPLSIGEAPIRWLRQLEPIGAEDRSLRMVFLVHANKIRCVAFSPDGTKVLIGSDDKIARLWEITGAKVLAPLEGHSGVITSVVFSPDGENMVTGSSDGTVLVWETASGKLRTALKGHTKSVMSMDFSLDGKQILTGSDDGTAKLWETESGRNLKTLEGQTGGVWSVAFSIDEKQMFTGSVDGIVQIWDNTSENQLKMLYSHIDTVTSIAFSPDRKKVLTGSADQTARLWETATGTLLKTLRGHTGMVTSVDFSPDGAMVLTGSADQTARLWETATGTLLKTLRGHTGMVTSVDFSPDGAMVLTSSDDSTAKLWNVANDTRLESWEAHSDIVKCVAFSPDGKHAVTGSIDQTVRLWETSTGKLVKTLGSHANAITSVAFSPDGGRIVTGSADQIACLWEINNSNPPIVLRGHTGTITSVAFSPNGTQVLTGSSDQTVRLWLTATGQPQRILQGNTGSVGSVIFSPDGTQILAGSDNGTVWLWETKSGNLLPPLQDHIDRVRSMAFSNDGMKMLTGSEDGKAWLRETGSRSLLAILDDHRGWVTSPAFSPDGHLVITCDQHGGMLLWQATGAEIGSLRLLAVYYAIYEIGAVFWQDDTHIVLADMGGPLFRPHFYRLQLEGIY